MVATIARAEHHADRVVLHDMDWAQFEQQLKGLGNHRTARIAYDNGSVEIMVSLPEHESFKEVISDAVKDIADELDIDYASYGSIAGGTLLLATLMTRSHP